MYRIIVAELKQEVSSFNPARSGYADFRVDVGSALLDRSRGAHEVAGAASVFEGAGNVEMVPTFGAISNTSGGILTADGFDRLAGELLDRLAACGDADGAYFSLHGAMQADNENDPEGYLLQEARRILGEAIPIVVSLDLHGILTDRMLRHSDAAVTYHTYPHVDFFETGERAASVLMNILTSDARPVIARVKIPALVRGDELITQTGSIRECIELAQQIEAAEGGLAAGVMWGNPFTDVPELRTNSVVVMDGDEQMARTHAIELAQRFWKHHEKMQVPLATLEESVRRATQIDTGTVVMMDAADAASSGASGDSNAILRELVRQGYRGKALLPLVDPAAVRDAFAAGVGGTVHANVGGAIDSERYQPLPLEARVRLLSDGKSRTESFGWSSDSGDTAVLTSDNFTLVVGTRPVSLFDRSWFYANGQDPRRFDLVVVKSPHCEPHMFADWCAELINVDAPGSTSANLASLGHTKCARPVFPLDEGVDLDPVADIFQRG